MINRVKMRQKLQKMMFKAKNKFKMKNKKAHKNQKKMNNKPTKIKINKNKLVYKLLLKRKVKQKAIPKIKNKTTKF